MFVASLVWRLILNRFFGFANRQSAPANRLHEFHYSAEALLFLLKFKRPESTTLQFHVHQCDRCRLLLMLTTTRGTVRVARSVSTYSAGAFLPRLSGHPREISFMPVRIERRFGGNHAGS